MLVEFRNWVNTNPSGIGPNDAVALLTGVQVLDDNGQTTVAGIGYVDSTCTTYKQSVTCDRAASWQGVYTLAHEIGHK